MAFTTMRLLTMSSRDVGRRAKAASTAPDRRKEVERDVARRLIVQRGAPSVTASSVLTAGSASMSSTRPRPPLGPSAVSRRRQGDGISDIAHPVDGQGRPRRLPHRRAVPVLAREPARQEAVPGRHDIPPGHDSENAGHRHRRLAVDAAEDAVGVGAADEDAVALARHGEIVGVAALAANEGRVLVAGHRLADAELGEGEIVQDERLVQCGDPLADGALGLAVGRSRSAPAAASGPGNPLI